jgi:hypothetical protein
VPRVGEVSPGSPIAACRSATTREDIGLPARGTSTAVRYGVPRFRVKIPILGERRAPRVVSGRWRFVHDALSQLGNEVGVRVKKAIKFQRAFMPPLKP